MTRRPARLFGERILVVLAALAVVVASSACRAPADRAAPEAPADRGRPAPVVADEVAPTPTVIPMQESSATFEVPIAASAPAPAQRPSEAFRSGEDRPADSPKRCLTLSASSSSSAAYGIRGEVVQLVVRARNGCSTNFNSASFRVTAIGPDGQDVGSAGGSFSGGIAPFGSAETLIAIPTKPSLSLTYRAEVIGY
jgi:hypothetical protein